MYKIADKSVADLRRAGKTLKEIYDIQMGLFPREVLFGFWEMCVFYDLPIPFGTSRHQSTVSARGKFVVPVPTGTPKVTVAVPKARPKTAVVTLAPRPVLKAKRQPEEWEKRLCKACKVPDTAPVSDILAGLSGAFRSALTLYYRDNKPIPALSSIMGIKPSTAAVYLSRARIKFYKIYQEVCA